MKLVAAGFCTTFLLVSSLVAQDMSSDELNANIALPKFNARLSVGFNYDLLRSPTDVSFEHSKGFFGINIPVEQTINLREIAGYMDPAIDSVFADTSLFTNGSEFKPQGSAKQNPNTTFQVDVPMLGGVCSFSNTQNFFFQYNNILGNPDLFLAPDSLQSGVSFLLRGTVNVPLYISLGWETMTFGYAYQLNKYLVAAINLHRHVFMIDLRAKMDIDILGTYNIDISGGGGELANTVAPINGELDYPSERINGQAWGHYQAEVWSPTIGLKLWRLSITSRFGVNTRAQGELTAKYNLPFFIDPETFEPTVDFSNQEELMEPKVRNALLTNATDSLGYSTDNDLVWRLPQGHTLAFEIIPNMIEVSYTKIIGDVAMYLEGISKESKPVESNTNRNLKNDTLVMDLGISVDHVTMLHCKLLGSFLNVGIFGFDVRYAQEKNIVGGVVAPEMRLGKMALLPILNMGTELGRKIKVLIELDALPLPAMRSGIVYNF